MSSLGALRGAACSAVVCEARPWAAYFSHLVSRDTAQAAGSRWGSCRGAWEGGRHLRSVGVCLALPGPGEEGDQPPGGEGAEGAEQENPRGQPPRAAEGGVALGLSPRGPEPFPREGLKVRGDLIGLHRKPRGTGWLQAQLDPGLWAVPSASCLPPPLRSADPWALLSLPSWAPECPWLLQAALSPAEGLFLCLRVCVKLLASLTNPSPGPVGWGCAWVISPSPKRVQGRTHETPLLAVLA